MSNCKISIPSIASDKVIEKVYIICFDEKTYEAYNHEMGSQCLLHQKL